MERNGSIFAALNGFMTVLVQFFFLKENPNGALLIGKKRYIADYTRQK
jgi:hypothetical protein